MPAIFSPSRFQPQPRVDKDPTRVFVLFCYRNMSANKPGASHIGLGCNALHMCKVLRRLGIRCQLFGVWTAQDVDNVVAAHPDATHCVIEAPWVGPGDLLSVIASHPHVWFVVRCHSQVGFLQVEPGAINLLRQVGTMQEGVLNLLLAGNSHRFCDYWTRVYNQRCLYLPNLYETNDRYELKYQHGHGTRFSPLRIGSFGAMRLLKNHTTAVAAALIIARGRGEDLEFYINSNREEHGKSVRQAVLNMVGNLKWAKVVEVPWCDWAQFRHAVAHCHLCLQPSMTETFNLVTADAAAEGVPSVVSDAIEWVPDHWQASTDDASEIARIGKSLLSDPTSGEDGYNALTQYTHDGSRVWLHWLQS